MGAELPGGRKQTLYGGDEDEDDEGTHQVRLEHLVSHLGVLRRDEEAEEEEEEEEEEKDKTKVRLEKSNTGH